MTGRPEPRRDVDEETLLQQCLDRPEHEQLDHLDRLCQLHAHLAEGLRHRYAALARHGLVSLPLAPGMRFGSYRLIEELGRGGMGIVYLAEHTALARRVALKLLSPLLLGSQRAEERFQREIAAMARLDHPGICPIYEAGEVNGQPFLAMRYVPGATLAERIAAARQEGRRFEVGEALGWLAEVAEAVAAAHAAGLVHRDLKPQNVVLGDDGRPVVLDFGLARDLQLQAPTLTHSHDPIGTAAYMAPEQIRGAPIGPPTDVHALGAMLYEALTLTQAFPGLQRNEVFHRVLEQAPIRLRQLRPDVTRDLELLIEVCLDKDPGRRYADAGALAEDLRRALAKQPLLARPLPRSLRVWRWSQRNRAAAVALGFLSVLAIASTAFLVRIASSDRATRGRSLVLAAIDAEDDSELSAMLAEAAYRLEPSVDTLDFLRSKLFEVHEEQIHRLPGAMFHDFVRVDDQRVLTFGESPTCVLWHRDQLDPMAEMTVHGKVLAAAASPSGTIAVLTAGGTVQFFDADGRTTAVAELTIGGALFLEWLDDHRLVLGCNGQANLVDVRTGATTPIVLPDAPPGIAVRTALSADRTTLLLGSHNHAYVCAIEQGLPGHVERLDGLDGTGMLWGLAVSADGARLLVASSTYRSGTAFQGTATALAGLWVRGPEGYERRRLITEHGSMMMRAQFSPDGARFAIGTDVGRVCVFDGESGNLIQGSDTADGTLVTGLAWSPAGHRLAATTTNRTTHVFDRDCRPIEVLRCFGLWTSEFSADGSRLMTLGFDALQVQRLERPERLFGHSAALYFAQPLDSERVAVCGKSGTVTIWRYGKSIAELGDPDADAKWILHCAATPSGDIVTSGSDGRVRRFAANGSVHRSDDLQCGWLSRILPLPDARLVVVAHGRPGACLLDADLKLVERLECPEAWGGDVTADGHWLVVGGVVDHVLRIWDLRSPSPKPVREIPVDTTWHMRAVAIADDGETVVAGGGDGILHRFDLRTGQHHSWTAHQGPVVDADIAADGRIATASADRTAAVWSPDGELLARLRGHATGLWSARFTPDGRHVATGSEDRTARIWPLAAEDVLAMATEYLHPLRRAAELRARAELTRDLLDRR